MTTSVTIPRFQTLDFQKVLGVAGFRVPSFLRFFLAAPPQLCHTNIAGWARASLQRSCFMRSFKCLVHQLLQKTLSNLWNALLQTCWPRLPTAKIAGLHIPLWS
eukprot:g8719.t1